MDQRRQHSSGLKCDEPLRLHAHDESALVGRQPRQIVLQPRLHFRHVITSNGLDDLWENQQLPTREAVARQFTDKTSEEQQELLARAMQQWQSENTRLYFLVKDSVVISGDWEALDRETIKERFTSGRLRDGVAFVQWVNSYHDHTTEAGQIALHAEFKRTMVLKSDGAGGSRAAMRKRWLEGYSVWKKLADSDESDRVKLEVYYKAMVNSLPSSPIEHPLVRVRMWLSEKLHERSSMFDRGIR